jgi:HNH endonuclease
MIRNLAWLKRATEPRKCPVEGMSDCLVWTGYLNPNGYAYLGIPGARKVIAHRHVYEVFKGPIPEGLTIDHLCKVRSCLNPDHLEAVTMRENLMRGESPCAVNSRKSHCIRGHAFDEKNSCRLPDGSKRCRTCFNNYMREYNREYRQELSA